MSNSTTAVFRATAAVARATKTGDATAEAAARRELCEAKIAAFIDKALATAPALSGDQVARLSALLGGDA